jgi:hypothetical protein
MLITANVINLLSKLIAVMDLIRKQHIYIYIKVALPECLILVGPSKHPREVHELLHSLFVAT